MPFRRDSQTNARPPSGTTKLRSFLTMFGIVWGITSVILLVGLGIGFNIDQKRKQPSVSIGTDIAICLRRQDRRPGLREDTPPAATFMLNGRATRIAIQQQASLVKTVSPGTAAAPSPKSASGTPRQAAPFEAVWPEYQSTSARSPSTRGASCHEQDDEPKADARHHPGRRSQTASSFPAKSVIGQTISWSRVIRIHSHRRPVEKKKQNGSYGSGPDNTQLFTTVLNAMARDFPTELHRASRASVRARSASVNNIVIDAGTSPDRPRKSSFFRCATNHRRAPPLRPGTTKKLSGPGTHSKDRSSPSASSAS